MKLLLMLFCFVCIQTKSPGKPEPKKDSVAKKAVKPSFRLAPSILIINY
jgi:hypothetical protein